MRVMGETGRSQGLRIRGQSLHKLVGSGYPESRLGCIMMIIKQVTQNFLFLTQAQISSWWYCKDPAVGLLGKTRHLDFYSQCSDRFCQISSCRKE